MHPSNSSTQFQSNLQKDSSPINAVKYTEKGNNLLTIFYFVYTFCQQSFLSSLILSYNVVGGTPNSNAAFLVFILPVTTALNAKVILVLS